MQESFELLTDEQEALRLSSLPMSSFGRADVVLDDGTYVQDALVYENYILGTYLPDVEQPLFFAGLSESLSQRKVRAAQRITPLHRLPLIGKRQRENWLKAHGATHDLFLVSRRDLNISFEAMVIHGWKLPPEVWPYAYLPDQLIEIPEHDLALVLHGVTEVRMGYVVGHLTILQNKNAPRVAAQFYPIIAAPDKLPDIWVEKAHGYVGYEAVFWHKLDSHHPLVLIRLDTLEFAFLADRGHSKVIFSDGSDGKVNISYLMPGSGEAEQEAVDPQSCVWFPASAATRIETCFRMLNQGGLRQRTENGWIKAIVPN